MSAKLNICAVSIWSAVALLGCDDSQLEQAAVQKYTEQVETKRLTEVAGQATAPMQTAATEHHIPENHLTYVGRYTIQISCEDKFVMCESGKVDYILTLLPDGTAHRIFVNAETALIHTAAIFLFYNQHECVRRLLLRPSEFGSKP